MNYFVCDLQVGCVLLIVVSRCGMFVIDLIARGEYYGYILCCGLVVLLLVGLL